MWRLAIAAAALLLAAAGCSSDDSSSGPESAAAPTPSATESTGTGTDTGSNASAGPCELVPPSALATVFRTGTPPEGEAKDLTEGFASCTWENDDAYLLVSTFPAPNFQSDFKGQLSMLGPVQSSVLTDGVAFPGTVGIGKANSKGTTVGFTVGDKGYLVAVRTGAEGDQKTDLPTATGVAEAVAQGS